MVVTSLMLWLGVALGAACISLGVLWLIGRYLPAPADSGTIAPPASAVSSFLFQGDLMFDHSAGALPDGADDTLSWVDLRAWFADRFDDLPHSLVDLPADCALQLAPRDADDTAQLVIERSQHGTRVALCDPPHACPAERHQMLIARQRLDAATDAIRAAPHPIWKTAPDGAVLWQNDACRAAFPPDVARPDIAAPDPGDGRTTRFSVPRAGAARPLWYEVRSALHAGEVLHHATDITKVVKAETMQKDFVQTLTKTFAHLTIGLAVFGHDRKLALFNPALVDLTSLSPEFLTAQPDLMAFFDSLRDRRVMPEPRDYASWRTQIGEMIESAQGGLYQETWTLPSDATYRVTGRPHPNGAVAFLFEDISAEIMLGRRFRAQVDLRQSALDTLPQAVMVIGPDNVLAFCNSAATRLLGIDPDTRFGDMTVADLMRACAAAIPAPALWHDVGRRLSVRAAGDALSQPTRIAPDQSVTCRVENLPGGARMLMLRRVADRTPRTAARLAAG